MEVTQDKILKYLKKGHIAITHASDEEEKFMYDFLVKKGFMNLAVSGAALLNDQGQEFIHNTSYFNPVPLTIFDWKMNIIEQLKDGHATLNGTGELKDQAVSELKQDGIIEDGSTKYFKTLTSKGRHFVASGLSYNDFLNGVKSVSAPQERLKAIKTSILTYLLAANKQIVEEIPNTENFNERLFTLAINELANDRLIEENNYSGWGITPNGENELTRHEFGLTKDTKPLISIGQIGNNKTDNRSYNLTNANNIAIESDDVVQSFKAHDVSNANNSSISATSTNPVIKWILVTISAIIAGLVVWYLTK